MSVISVYSNSVVICIARWLSLEISATRYIVSKAVNKINNLKKVFKIALTVSVVVGYGYVKSIVFVFH